MAGQPEIHSIRISVVDSSTGLDRVRAAARAAGVTGGDLEVVVLYNPPSRRALERIRQVVPEELRWRVHGSMLADQMTQKVREIAREEGVRAHIETQTRTGT